MKWEAVPAKLESGAWTASIAKAADGEQVIAYASALDITGNLASSDTIEIPEYPKWRGGAGR